MSYFEEGMGLAKVLSMVRGLLLDENSNYRSAGQQLGPSHDDPSLYYDPSMGNATFIEVSLLSPTFCAVNGEHSQETTSVVFSHPLKLPEYVSMDQFALITSFNLALSIHTDAFKAPLKLATISIKRLWNSGILHIL
jgi:hypothetical protein